MNEAKYSELLKIAEKHDPSLIARLLAALIDAD
jgi:hypothetical protein